MKFPNWGEQHQQRGQACGNKENPLGSKESVWEQGGAGGNKPLA